MTALEIACRKCAAQPGEPCFNDWVWSNQHQDYLKAFCAPHEERVFDAQTFGQAAVPVDKDVIDRAAEGLV